MLPRLRGARFAGLLIAVAVAPAMPALGQTPATVGQPAAPILRLKDALTRAATGDPGAIASAARLKAAEAAVRQAAVRPTPSLALEVENFAGTGPYSLLGGSETTLSYERTFERGGKLEARTGRARAEQEAARLRGEVRRLDFIRDAQTAYAETLAAEAGLLVAEARLISARQSQLEIDRRVKSARDPLFASSRAEALTAQAEITRDRMRDTARTARAVLSAFWEGPPDFTLSLDDFFNVASPTVRPMADTPDLALLEADRDVARAAILIEQSRTIPDPTLRGGVRYFGEGDVALVVGGSIAIGVRVGNQANIERAQADRVAAEAEITAARRLRDLEIVRLTTRLRALALESERIRTEVIPFATRSVEQVTAGFNRGGFEYLDVTEAERALGDARARRVEVLREFHTNHAVLDRLAGTHWPLVATAVTEERR